MHMSAANKADVPERLDQVLCPREARGSGLLLVLLTSLLELRLHALSLAFQVRVLASHLAARNQAIAELRPGVRSPFACATSLLRLIVTR